MLVILRSDALKALFWWPGLGQHGSLGDLLQWRPHQKVLLAGYFFTVNAFCGPSPRSRDPADFGNWFVRWRKKTRNSARRRIPSFVPSLLTPSFLPFLPLLPFFLPSSFPPFAILRPSVLPSWSCERTDETKIQDGSQNKWRWRYVMKYWNFSGWIHVWMKEPTDI